MANINNLAIVTVTFNSESVIREFLDSLILQTYNDWTLYLIDNSSTDETVKIVKEYKESRIKIDLQPNKGFATSTNRGITAGLKNEHELFLLINNDTAFNPDFLQNLLSVKQNSPDSDIIAPKIYNYYKRNVVWYGGQNFHKYLKYKPVATKIVSNHYCEAAPMCCTLITKHAFEMNGFLDEKYFVYVEDTDWFFRAIAVKLKMFYCTEAFLYHKCSALTTRNSKFTEYYGQVGSALFIRKHFTGIKKYIYVLIKIISTIRLLLFGISGIRRYYWRMSGFFAGLAIKNR